VNAARVVGFVTLLTTSMAANAADMPLKAPPPTPPPFSWTGFYIGINGGLAAGSWKGLVTEFGLPKVDFPGERTVNANGAFGGVQIGFNWEGGILDPHVVLGLEADIEGVDFTGSNTFVSGPPFFGSFVKDEDFKMKYFGTVRTRLGYDLGGFLPYATGGFAYGRTHLQETAFIPGLAAITTGPSGIASADENRVGWTAGLGFEYAPAFAPQWSVKAEWLYVDLGTTNPIFVGTISPALGGGVFNTDGFQGHLTFNTIKVGVNYRWW